MVHQDLTDCLPPQNHSRIAVMEHLEELTRVETLCLRWNLISKIQNLSTLTTLTELDLHDNQASFRETQYWFTRQILYREICYVGEQFKIWGY